MANQQEEARPVHYVAGATEKRTRCGYKAWRIKKSERQGDVNCRRCLDLLAKDAPPTAHQGAANDHAR